MEEKTERTHPLTLIAIKFAWAAILVALALPNALDWGAKPEGLLTATMLTILLVAVAVSPLLVAYAAAEQNIRALRTLRRLRRARTSNT